MGVILYFKKIYNKILYKKQYKKRFNTLAEKIVNTIELIQYPMLEYEVCDIKKDKIKCKCRYIIPVGSSYEIIYITVCTLPPEIQFEIKNFNRFRLLKKII